MCVCVCVERERERESADMVDRQELLNLIRTKCKVISPSPAAKMPPYDDAHVHHVPRQLPAGRITVSVYHRSSFFKMVIYIYMCVHLAVLYV
jgi:hypothetical protein